MRAAGCGGALVTRAVALLFVVCLAEVAAGSCLSYGHSCWGAHGKRSGKAQTDEEAPPSHLSDWYLAKLLRRMSGAGLYPARKLMPMDNLSNSDLNAIFRERLDDGQDIAKLFESGEPAAAAERERATPRRDADADADVEPQVKAKLLQIMREASDDK